MPQFMGIACKIVSEMIMGKHTRAEFIKGMHANYNQKSGY